MTAPVTGCAWVDVDMRHLDLGRRAGDWWMAFYTRTPNRTLESGHIRVPCDNHATAAHTAALLRAFGISGAALKVGGQK